MKTIYYKILNRASRKQSPYFHTYVIKIILNVSVISV
jgi:hypothetical protein